MPDTMKKSMFWWPWQTERVEAMLAGMAVGMALGIGRMKRRKKNG